jgi:hypothetical protein
MTALFASVIVVAVLWLVWRFVARLWSPQQPAEPISPDSFVPTTRKRGPSGRCAAVALEEPDDGDTEYFAPRHQ